MNLIGLTIKELIKAYEIVEAENPAGELQVRRGRTLAYLRKLLMDDLLEKEKLF